MDSCPVCYVTFSTTHAEDVARKLPCEHVACTQCLEDCFEEASERGDKTSPPVSLTSAVCRSVNRQYLVVVKQEEHLKCGDTQAHRYDSTAVVVHNGQGLPL